jgi:hypothetical protein
LSCKQPGFTAVEYQAGIGGELDKLYEASALQDDDDLVVANPHTGKALNRHALTKLRGLRARSA